jgi:hypothetical protein
MKVICSENAHLFTHFAEKIQRLFNLNDLILEIAKAFGSEAKKKQGSLIRLSKFFCVFTFNDIRYFFRGGK